MKNIKYKTQIITLSIFLFIFLFGLYTRFSIKHKVLGETDVAKKQVVGLVIPHHDLASGLIIDAIEEIKSEEYERIVILGPNHFYPDSPLVVTTDILRDYAIDGDYTDDLVSNYDFVAMNKEILDGEHSVGIPIKYLGERFPDAKFTPLIISPFYNDIELVELALRISRDFSERTLFVLAVDFAHNVGLDEALENNEESINAIKGFDFDTLLEYDDKHIDSPVASIIFLKIMQNLSATSWKTLTSSHGSIIEGVPDLQGTSYVTGFFSN